MSEPKKEPTLQDLLDAVGATAFRIVRDLSPAEIDEVWAEKRRRLANIAWLEKAVPASKEPQ